MQCLILAGGLGTRLYPATHSVPKCLIEVAGRPFAAWQLDWLAGQGVRRVVYSVGHLGAMVPAALGDGSAWDLELTYVDEGEDRLGTGGAVRLAVEQGSVEDAFFVLYGDSFLSIDLGDVERDFIRRHPDALMTVFRNQGRFDASNAVLAGGMVTRYEKGLSPPPPDMEYVDYGLSVLRRAVVLETVPGGPSDLADALGVLSRAGRLAGYEATERFYEIGSPAGLAALEARLAGSAAADEAHRRR